MFSISQTVGSPNGPVLACFVIGVVALVASAPASADVSGSAVAGNVIRSFQDSVGGSSGSSSSTAQVVAHASAAGSVSSGLLRASFSGTSSQTFDDGFAEASVLIQETLMLQGPTTTVPLSFHMSVHGTLERTSVGGGGANLRGGANIIEGRLHFDDNHSGIGSSGFALRRSLFEDMNGAVLLDTLDPSFYGQHGTFLAQNGVDVVAELVSTSVVRTGTPIFFDALLRAQNVSAYGIFSTGANFSQTARISVELPTGYTLTSTSGHFLSAAAVPEPTSWSLMLAGLACFGFMRRRAVSLSPGSSLPAIGC